MGYRLGVDLGTTFSAAAIESGGRTEVVHLGDHAAQIPSLVFVREDDRLLVGEAAARRGTAQPDRLAREFKRRLGDRVPYVLGGRSITAVELTAQLLRTVVDEVVRRQGGPPDRLALTHPANWGAHRRELLLESVGRAGVGPVTTMTEPAAAAVHFASTERADVGDVVAVYDLGGGTFDAAVLRKAPAEFELMGSPHGVEQLGGIDLDDLVFRWVLRSLDVAPDLLDVDDPVVVADLARLRTECTGAKEALSRDSEATITLGLPGVAHDKVRLGRAEFEDMIAPSVDRTVTCLRRALASASVTSADVRTVVLVGGSARIPLVAQKLGHELGRPVSVSPQPKLAVALGAALLAGGVMPGPPPHRPPPSRPPSPPPPSQPPPPPGRDPITIRTSGPPVLPTHQPPPSPPPVATARSWRPVGALVGLLLLAVGLAFGAPPLVRTTPPAGLTVNGAGPSGATFGDVDLERPVALLLPAAGSELLTAQPGVLGLPLGGPVAASPARGDPRTRSLDLLAYAIVPGPLRLGLRSGTAEVGDVVLQSSGFVPLRWAPLLMALFVAAYTESLLRRVRGRRRVRPADLAGMAGTGAFSGLVLVLGSWTLAGNDVPLWATLGAPLACAGAWFLLTTIVAARRAGP